MRHLGNQVRTTLDEVNMVLLKKFKNQAILLDTDTCKTELWIEHDDHEGYIIEIEGKGYEYGKTLN